MALEGSVGGGVRTTLLRGFGVGVSKTPSSEGLSLRFGRGGEAGGEERGKVDGIEGKTSFCSGSLSSLSLIG